MSMIPFFPSLMPPTTNALWFDIDIACDEDSEVTGRYLLTCLIQSIYKLSFGNSSIRNRSSTVVEHNFSDSTRSESTWENTS